MLPKTIVNTLAGTSTTPDVYPNVLANHQVKLSPQGPQATEVPTSSATISTQSQQAIPQVVDLGSVTLTSVQLQKLVESLHWNSHELISFTTTFPFTPEVLTYPLLDRFKYLCVKEFKNMPYWSLECLHWLHESPSNSNVVMCKTFPQTLDYFEG